MVRGKRSPNVWPRDTGDIVIDEYWFTGAILSWMIVEAIKFFVKRRDSETKTGLTADERAWLKELHDWHKQTDLVEYLSHQQMSDRLKIMNERQIDVKNVLLKILDRLDRL